MRPCRVICLAPLVLACSSRAHDLAEGRDFPCGTPPWKHEVMATGIPWTPRRLGQRELKVLARRQPRDTTFARVAGRALRRLAAPAVLWLLVSYIDGVLWFCLCPAAVASSKRQHGSGSRVEAAMVYFGPFCLLHSLLSLAAASHIAVILSDPGFVPRSAAPLHGQPASGFCRTCMAFKPPRAHHCRTCRRCVARMDHHCLWAANCIGAGNLKQFLLLLLYSAAAAATALALVIHFSTRIVLQTMPVSGGAFPRGPAAKAAAAAGGAAVAAALTVGPAGQGSGRPPAQWGAASAASATVAARGGILAAALSLLLLAWALLLLAAQARGLSVGAGTVDRLLAAEQQEARRARGTSATAGAPTLPPPPPPPPPWELQGHDSDAAATGYSAGPGAVAKTRRRPVAWGHILWGGPPIPPPPPPGPRPPPPPPPIDATGPCAGTTGPPWPPGPKREGTPPRLTGTGAAGLGGGDSEGGRPGGPGPKLAPSQVVQADANPGGGAGCRDEVSRGRCWHAVRHDVLGPGPRALWLLPTPAQLSADSEARVRGYVLP